MFTQCPACSTVYRLRLDQLRAARGQVRCSRCDAIFDALDHRVSQQAPAPAQQAPQDDHAAQAAALTGATTILSATALAETPAETSIDNESSPAGDNRPASSLHQELDLADTSEPDTSTIEADEPIEDLPQELDLADTPEPGTSTIEVDAPIEDFPQGLDLADTSETSTSALDEDGTAEHLLEELDLDLVTSPETTTRAIDVEEASERVPDELELTDTSETIASALDEDDTAENLLEELDLDLVTSPEITTHAIDVEEASEHLPDELELTDTSETISSSLEEGDAADKLPDDSELTTVSEHAPLSSDDAIANSDSPLNTVPPEGGEDETLGLWDDGEASPAPDHLGEALQAIDLDSPEFDPDGAADNAFDNTLGQPSFEADADDVSAEEEDTLSSKVEGIEEAFSSELEDETSTHDAQTEIETAWPELLTGLELAPEDGLAEEETSGLPGIAIQPEPDLLEEDFASLWDSALDTEQAGALLPDEAEPRLETAESSPAAGTEATDSPAEENKGWDDFSEQHIESLLTPAEGAELPDIAMDDGGDVVMNTELLGLGEDEELDLAAFASDDGDELEFNDFDLEQSAPSSPARQKHDPDAALLKQLLPEEEDDLELELDPPATERVATATPAAPQSVPDSARQTSGYHLEPEEAPQRGSGSFRALLWAGGILLMLAALAGQFIYYHQTSLATHPQLRPLLAQLCHFSECELPPQRDLGQIRLASHLVQFHPRHQDSLLITATLINRADFAQPYPEVALHMTNLQQQVVASRRFSPQEYLVGQRSDRPMPQNIEIPLMLEVLDPGREVVGFRFEFY